MTRKRFRKLMMSMGFRRNDVDDYLDFCARVGKEPEKPNVL